MFLLFILVAIVGAWIIIRQLVKKIFRIEDADNGFFSSPYDSVHQKWKYVSAALYIVIAFVFAGGIWNEALLLYALGALVIAVMIDAAVQMYMDINKSGQPRIAALTLCDAVIIIAALLFSISRL
ncbi:hypothetical protein [Alkalicoccus luteus]|uniref:DUF4181 domain-containing protein n=1 Tax=Alkalicoccus luteus TaxID=1237094 RepID=A0A969PQ56_9BACI|nr:hypothetical protein [Alkalicoccus luteus]NJP37515.1 hypothetical protein [Alkalicoccus luteus]